MYTLGVVLLILSVVSVFGADILIRKGKIKQVKTVLIIKFSGLFLTIIAAALLILNNK